MNPSHLLRMQDIPTIRIFISSPGDVSAEREKAREVIGQLEKRYGGQLHLRPVFWEDLPLQADRSFQEGIDDAVAHQAGVDALLAKNTGIDIAVFILWSRLGSPLGTRILKQDGTPYRSGTEREWDLALQARAQSGGKRPAILAYLRRDQEGFIAGQRGRDTAALEEMVRQRKLAEQFIQENFLDAETKTNVRAYHSFSQPITFAHRLRTHLKALLDERVADLAIGAARWDVAVQGSPFRGLEPFEFEHAPLFFGRDAECCDLQVRLREQAERGNAFVLLVGASGSGKSSLARAGLAPAVVQFDADGVAWRHSVLVPSDSKLADGRTFDLCVGLARALAAPTAFPELKQYDPELLDLGEGLARDPEVAFKLRVRPSSSDRRLLLVIDQFEEIFTLGSDAAAQTALVRALGVLARSGVVWIVATVRGDYYGHCQQLPDLMALKGDLGQFDLLAPGAASLRQIIVEPARMAGLGFEERNGRTLDAQLLHDAEGQNEALPLLEFCLDALFERQQARGDRWLTWTDYEAMRLVEESDETTGEKRVREAESGLAGALTSEAERALGGLDQQFQREALRAVFGKLLDLSIGEKETPVRRVARYADLVASPYGAGSLAGAQAVVDAFIGRRLLVSYQDAAGERVVAVAHEALLRNWGRLQRLQAEWADHFRIRLRLEQRLAEYAADPDDSRVIPEGLPSNEAVRLMKEASELVSEDLRQYVVMSLAAHEKRRRRRVRLRNAITTVLVVLLALAGWQWREARIALEVADRKTREAQAAQVQSGQLAEEGSKQLDIASRSAVNQAKRLFAEADGADLSTAAGIARREQKSGEGLLYLARALRFNPNAVEARDEIGSQIVSRREALRKFSIRSLRHEGAVNNAQFSPDGRRIVTASKDNTARVWDVVSGKPLGEPLHQDLVNSAQFSPDGTRIVTTSRVGTVRVWDAMSGKALGGPFRHESGVNSAQFSPDGARIVTASYDKTARIWDVASGKALGEPLRHKGGVLNAAYSPDGTRIVTASADHTARVWDAASGKPLSDLLGHESGVSSAQFSPDGTRIVTASLDDTARIWDAASGKVIGEPLRHERQVDSAEFSPDGTRVVTASGDKTARVWDAVSGKALGEPLRHEGTVWSAKFSPDGRRVVTASDDNTTRIWDAASQMPIGGALRHGGSVNSAQYSPDGTKVVTASDDQTARVWDAASVEAIDESLRHEERVNSAQFSPDGTRVVTACGDQTARVWDVASGEALGKPLNQEGDVLSAQFNSDGKRIVTASDDGTARVWDVASGKPLGESLLHEGRVNSAQFSRDSMRIVTASSDGAARVWDAASGKVREGLLRHESGVNSATFSPDDMMIVTAGMDGTARVWDAASGQAVGEPFRHEGYVYSAQFSPDGTRIVTACGDQTARVWDVASRKLLGEPLRHPGGRHSVVYSAQFSPDGLRIVTASEDKTARIWDAISGKPLGEPLRHKMAVKSARFSSDGTRIVTGCSDGTARVWDTISGKALRKMTVDDVEMLAEVLSGARLAEDGELSPLEGRAWDQKIVDLIARGQLDPNTPEASVIRWLTNSGADGPIGPTNSQTRRERAEVLIGNGMSGDVYEAYNLWPAHPLIHLALAGIEWIKPGGTPEETEEAAKAAQRVAFLRGYSLKRLPDDPVMQFRAAELLRKQKQPSLALRCIERVLAQRPDDTKALAFRDALRAELPTADGTDNSASSPAKSNDR